jgi:hypothetical protein
MNRLIFIVAVLLNGSLMNYRQRNFKVAKLQPWVLLCPYFSFKPELTSQNR